MAVDDDGTATACLIFLFVIPCGPAGLCIEAYAISVRADYAGHTLAGIRRQEVFAATATIFATRFVLVANFLLRKLRHLSGLVAIPVAFLGAVVHAHFG